MYEIQLYTRIYPIYRGSFIQSELNETAWKTSRTKNLSFSHIRSSCNVPLHNSCATLQIHSVPCIERRGEQQLKSIKFDGGTSVVVFGYGDKKAVDFAPNSRRLVFITRTLFIATQSRRRWRTISDAANNILRINVRWQIRFCEKSIS